MRARAAEDAFAREACFALADLKTLVPVAAERPDPETRRRRDAACLLSKKLFSQQKRERTPRARAFPEDDDFGVPTAVRVFGFRAPDPGDLAEFRAEELGAALGALLLFTETASNAIGAARLARGDGAGSDRARVWVPESYFEEASPTQPRRSRLVSDAVAGGSPPDALPLYLPRDVVEANGGGDRAAAARRCAAERESVGSVGARVKGTMAGIAATGATAAAALARANFVADRTPRTPPTPSKTAAVLTAGSPSQLTRDPGDPAVLARHRAELHRALATLHRHAGATCVELERVLGDVAAPAKWGPFASLAFLVTEASRRARAARDAERRAESLTDTSRARSNPFFDDDDELSLSLSLSLSSARTSTARDGVGDVGAGDVRSERPSVHSRAAGGGNGGFHGKQSLMTSVFGGGGTVGGVRRDVSASSGAPASKGGDASRARGAGGRRVETRKSYASPSDASVAELAADGWDLVEHPARAAAGRCAEGLGLRVKKNADEPAMLPPPPSAPEDVEHWTRAMYVDARR